MQYAHSKNIVAKKAKKNTYAQCAYKTLKMGHRNKTRITTNIDQNIWKKAMFSNIRWCDALETGIEVLCGDFQNQSTIEDQIKKVKEEEQLVKAKLLHLNKKLNECKNKETEKQESRRRRIVA